MGRFLNPGNKAFQKTLKSEIYVDKTMLLAYTNKVMGSDMACICNSRPRRFGKSITANMLAAYYSRGCDSFDMFSALKVGRLDSFETNLNKYDVIHIHGNSATMAVETMAAALAGVKVRIAHSHNTTCTHMKAHRILYPFFCYKDISV